jgi:hypothetical protein
MGDTLHVWEMPRPTRAAWPVLSAQAQSFAKEDLRAKPARARQEFGRAMPRPPAPARHAKRTGAKRAAMTCGKATMTNTLIFVDLASDDPSAAGRFYAEVFGWENDARPEGIYHRMVPGGFFKNKDGTDSQIGNLHLGIFDAANARPTPTPPALNRAA